MRITPRVSEGPWSLPARRTGANFSSAFQVPATAKYSGAKRWLSALIQEHVCSPPDPCSNWVAVSQYAPPVTKRYSCPECGQHLVRREHYPPKV